MPGRSAAARRLSGARRARAKYVAGKKRQCVIIIWHAQRACAVVCVGAWHHAVPQPVLAWGRPAHTACILHDAFVNPHARVRAVRVSHVCSSRPGPPASAPSTNTSTHTAGERPSADARAGVQMQQPPRRTAEVTNSFISLPDLRRHWCSWLPCWQHAPSPCHLWALAAQKRQQQQQQQWPPLGAALHPPALAAQGARGTRAHLLAEFRPKFRPWDGAT